MSFCFSVSAFFFCISNIISCFLLLQRETVKQLLISVSTLLLKTYRSSRFLIVDLEVGHGFDDCHDGLDCVAVDNCSVLLALIF